LKRNSSGLSLKPTTSKRLKNVKITESRSSFSIRSSPNRVIPGGRYGLSPSRGHNLSSASCDRSNNYDSGEFVPESPMQDSANKRRRRSTSPSPIRSSPSRVIPGGRYGPSPSRGHKFSSAISNRYNHYESEEPVIECSISGSARSLI
jgi:hypothetical protein